MAEIPFHTGLAESDRPTFEWAHCTALAMTTSVWRYGSDGDNDLNATLAQRCITWRWLIVTDATLAQCSIIQHWLNVALCFVGSMSHIICDVGSTLRYATLAQCSIIQRWLNVALFFVGSMSHMRRWLNVALCDVGTMTHWIAIGIACRDEFPKLAEAAGNARGVPNAQVTHASPLTQYCRPVASQPGGGVWTWMGGTPGAPPPLDHCPRDVINLKNAPTLGHSQAPPLDIVRVTSSALRKIEKHPPLGHSQAPPPLGHCPCDVIHIPRVEQNC